VIVRCAIASALITLTASGARASESQPPISPATRGNSAGTDGETSELAIQRLKLSAYEREALEIVLKDKHLELEPAPEGKLLEGVDIAPLDVFEPRDPAPAFLNWFHHTTRPIVVERELLMPRERPWEAWRAEETARRLRALRQLSLVLVVPVKGSDGEHVRALIVTKDVWSLRLNTGIAYRNGKLEYLLLQPSEENVAGTHLRLAGLYIYDVLSNSFGAIASHPRILGTHLSFLASSSVVVERSTGKIDGTVGGFSFGQPLYASDTRWAYGTTLQWSDRVIRWVAPSTNGALVERRYDSPSTIGNDNLPWEYRARELYWITFVTRSYGLLSKADISWGLEAQQHRYASDASQSRYDPRVTQEFLSKEVEHSDTRLGPFARLDVYRNKYVSLMDIETLGLQEDFPIGYRLLLKSYAASHYAQSSRDILGTVTGLSYTFPLNNGLAIAWGVHSLEVTPNQNKNDATIQGGVRVVTPFVGPLRIVYDGGAFSRYRDYLHVRYALGGDSRLRGYPSRQFIGSNFVTSNLELRTRPLRLWTILLGLEGFYDAGDSFDDWHNIRPKHSLGVGIRGLFPQFQRIVGRLECAFPLDRPSLPGQHWGNFDVLLTVEGQPFGTPQLVSRGSPLLAPAQ
jgi:hypothetical protein